MATPQITPVETAQYVLAQCGKMSHLKLQKLVYYIQAWHLAYFKAPLFEDDFCAWVHGPVCKAIWREFKSADSPLFNKLDIPKSKKTLVVRTVRRALSSDQIDLIGDVLKEYADKSAYYLECLTHSEPPWKKARANTPPDKPSNAVISKISMMEFYRALLYGKHAEDKAGA